MAQRGLGYWSWGLRAAGAGGHPFSEPWGDPFAEGEFLVFMIAAGIALAKQFYPSQIWSCLDAATNVLICLGG
jgi:hypothetical protein